MMVVVNRMCVSIGTFSASLEIFSADKAPVDVDIGQTDRAQLLKVEIEGCSVYLCQDQRKGQVLSGWTDIQYPGTDRPVANRYLDAEEEA